MANCKKLLSLTSSSSSSNATFESVYIITTTLLSLLLPLSFLLLARISIAHYIFSLPPFPPPSPFLTLFIYTNPVFLHVLVSLVSLAALIHGLTGRITTNSPPAIRFRPRLDAAWFFLCSLQVCVGLGIEGSIAVGIDGSEGLFGRERTLLSRVVFFLGLHETTVYWSRAVVKPVVEDTVFGCAREERWVERAAMAVCLGGLWWWRLRDEVESLVAMVEVKREMSDFVGFGDIVGWWLYYVTVTIGMVKIVRGIMWAAAVLLRRTAERDEAKTEADKYGKGNTVEEKV